MSVCDRPTAGQHTCIATARQHTCIAASLPFTYPTIFFFILCLSNSIQLAQM
jgi:hypothetical protein